MTAEISGALNYKQYFSDIALRLSFGSYPRFEVLDDHQELGES